MMQLTEHMDRLLAGAEDRGRTPVHFLVREKDWKALRGSLEGGLHPDPSNQNAYKGVPVEFSQLHDRAIVALVDNIGDQVEAEEG